MIQSNPYRPSRLWRTASAALVGASVLLALPWQVTAQSSPSPALPGLLKNGGFDQGDGTPTGWTRGSLLGDWPTDITATVDTTTKHAGRAALRYTRSSARYNPVAVMWQLVQVSGAKRVRISLWSKADKAGKATVSLQFNHGGESNIEWGAYIGDYSGNDGPATYDWKKSVSVIQVPSGTDSIVVSTQMYGPGTVWMDDLSVEVVGTDVPLRSIEDKSATEDALADVADVPIQDLRAGADPYMRYILTGTQNAAPVDGYKLLFVLPGGDGSAEFSPFVRRVFKNALPPGYLVAQLVAPKWSDDQFTQIVWPTKKVRWGTMKFATEDFLNAVLKDIEKRAKVDHTKIYGWGWSSGGPAVYASLLGNTPLTGAFVAMSVFKPNELPSLTAARGKKVYLLQSPQDFIPIRMAQDAESMLRTGGATTKLVTYEGGHGWHGDIFGQIRSGVEWLETK